SNSEPIWQRDVRVIETRGRHYWIRMTVLNAYDLVTLHDAGDRLAIAAWAANTVRPSQFFHVGAALYFCVERFHQSHHIHCLFHMEFSMPRRKKAHDLTTEEVLKRLFPAKVRKVLKQTAEQLSNE